MNTHTTGFKPDQGICEHSSQSYWDEYVIFCVGNDLIKDQAFMQWALANHVSYQIMLGRYNGVTERSYMINMADVYRCWHWFEYEESILVLGRPEAFRYGMRPAKLVYLKSGSWGTEEDLGFWHCVTQAEAFAAEAYSLDLKTGRFWVARPKDHRTHPRNRGMAA